MKAPTALILACMSSLSPELVEGKKAAAEMPAWETKQEPVAEGGGITISAEEESIHEELRAVRDALLEAVNAGDVDRTLSFLHENVVVTWQNAEVSRGHEGVRAYYDRMMTGPERIVREFSTAVTVDELTILYGGDAGIAFGSSEDTFVLTDGTAFTLPGRWSATLVKEDGRWVIADFHASTNLFDNPVLNLARRAIYWVGGVVFVIGAALGAIAVLVARRMRRRPA